ncbi:nuclear transport factor 2 family protein [Streptomyces phyllanthi]|uniref:Nuclear transport factor 2 family protein n=1 Tax=Streptomyces phyllanthi TaxID=1803180 RepID=A0A5N8WC93_9ACTN|nr:nuclear transport factor 2 family protein [Streptomyces phyllanthi]MPY43755.1 nuclear transport factor 2 family protein [Streptomyces phyllanthi]
MSSVAYRQDVIDACTRMAWYIDTRAWDALEEVFSDEIRLDYTSLNGGEPAVLTRKELIDAWSGLLGGFSATQHLLSNWLVDVERDKAVATSMFQATHRMPNEHGSPLWTLGGRYRFDLERTRGGWRINGVVMTATWADGNQHLLALAAEKQSEKN